MIRKLFLISFLLALLVSPLRSTDTVSTTRTKLQLIAENQSIQRGQSFWVGIYFKLDPHWHTYYKNPGDSGLPAKIKWQLPNGFEAGPIQWPAPTQLVIAGLTNYAYEKEVLLLSRITPPKNLDPTQTISIQAEVDWLVCKEICLPASANLTLSLPVSLGIPQTDSRWEKLITDTLVSVQQENQGVILKHHNPINLWIVLGAAFLGGVILNLMPCVFPVLAIKVLSFVHLSKETGSKPLRHGLAFGTGILISFWTLTVFIFILKALGQQIGWGFQLQNSTFVGLLIGIFFLLSLSLLGFFEINFVLPSHTVQKNKLSTSFWQGVLAVLVATPCTAPFMGWAIGYAFTQNLLIAFFIFTFIGIGLSFPYVILSASPRLIQKLPKPGGWMETFKKLLALPLLATVFWLGWVLSFQIHNQGILLVLLGLFILSTAIASLKIHFKNIKTKKIIVALLLLAGFGIIFGASTLDLEKKHQTDSNSIWQPYSQEKVLESIRQEKPVFVDFTAKWCLTCQVNKKLVLTRPQVIHYFQKNNFTLLVADWTEQDAGITQALTRLGRSGVPTYVLYTFPDFSPQVLPEILTVSMFTKIDQ